MVFIFLAYCTCHLIWNAWQYLFHSSKTYKQHPTVFEDKESLIRTLKYPFELVLV